MLERLGPQPALEPLLWDGSDAMVTRWNAWYTQYGPLVMAAILLFAMVVAGLHGDWLMGVILLTLAGIMLQYERSLDLAFQRGWTAGCSAYDDELAAVLPPMQRLLIYGSALAARSSRRRYDADTMAMLRELANLPVDATHEDQMAIYEKYRRR